MAGQPIRKLQEAKIARYGIDVILSRIELGENLRQIAATLGMPRGSLSTHLNRDPTTATALAYARVIAAERRLLGRERVGAPGVQRWLRKARAAREERVTDPGQLLLAALKAQRETDRAPRQDVPTPPDPTAELRAPGCGASAARPCAKLSPP